MAIRAGHGPPNGEEATLRLASANEMTRPSRLGASTSVNYQSAQVSGTLGPTEATEERTSDARVEIGGYRRRRGCSG